MASSQDDNPNHIQTSTNDSGGHQVQIVQGQTVHPEHLLPQQASMRELGQHQEHELPSGTQDDAHLMGQQGKQPDAKHLKQCNLGTAISAKALCSGKSNLMKIFPGWLLPLACRH